MTILLSPLHRLSKCSDVPRDKRGPVPRHDALNAELARVLEHGRADLAPHVR